MVLEGSRKVKEEDWTDSDSSSDIEILDQKPAPVASSDVEPFSSAKSADERSFPTSSSDHVKSYFVGMGFAPTLVDKVFRQNVEADTELLLEALIRESSSGLEASTSVKEEIESPLDFELDDELDTKHPSTPFQDADKRLYLLLMEFSEEEVDRAINQLGESVPLQELVDFIVTAQTEGVSEVNDRKGSESDLKKDEEHTSEALFGVMEKTLHLLQMGFTEEEVSTAIDNFGPDLSIGKLADSIFMSRLSQRVKKEEDQTAGASEIKTEPESPDCSDHALEGLKSCSSVPGRREANASSSKSEYYDYEENVRVKKAKCTIVNDESSFWCGATQQAKREAVQQSKPYHCSQFKETSELTFVKEEMPEKMIPNPKGSIRGSFYRSPYFFYGNVVEVSPGTWRKLSGFLYSTEPEFINCQFFSALMRKEGYIHNLPKGTRINILPRPPMTLQEALPHAKKWWPLWDTRKHLSCINDENRVAPQICEKLEQMLVSSRGTLAEEQKSFILQQCKTFNLIWMGQNKLSLVEPEQLEFILGYPRHHTQILGLEGDERFRALKYSFQIDTLGYCLSTLKAQYPDGLRVLSIYSGIGGAEIALHRLGIRLKCVVSVEASEASRKIIKRWWQSTGQSGELIQIAGIHKLTMQTLINFIQQFGGFDLVIGGNPCTCIDGSSSVVSSQMGMDQGLFMEFVRVLQRVKSIMGINW